MGPTGSTALELASIEDEVIHLFALVAEGVVAATEALLSDDTALATDVVRRDDMVDRLYRQLEDLALERLTAEPAKPDLVRYLVFVLRVVPELERSSDLVRHIARRTGHGLAEQLTPRARGLVSEMGRVAGELWRLSADAFVERDDDLALSLNDRDEALDDLHVSLTVELASGRLDLPIALDMALVARFYERLGDHAVNVARRVPSLGGITWK
jgi:phosphate transport system protein